MISVLTTIASLVLLVGGTSAPTPQAPLIFGYPETAPRLQLYQDAWKFMTKKESLYLAYTNFKTNRLGQDMSCIKANTVALIAENHVVNHNVTYYNATAGKTMSFTKSYRALSSEDYDTQNILEGTVPGEGSNLYHALYAGPECAILRDDGKSNGTFKACEMWVLESGIRNPVPCCDFIFDLLCSSGYKLITYYEPFCKLDDKK